jgi:thiosulfate/3-mercaptopyruvate sulfurtransferase
VNLGDPTLTLRDTLTEDYLPTADIEKSLGAAGVDPAREIIVYGDRGLPSTYFAQLTLRHFGAADARVFHEGIEGWRAAGLPVQTGPGKPKPVTLRLVPQPGVIVSSKEVVAALKRADVQFLDARTVREFRGEDIRAIRGGHIPGAVNIPFEQNWVDPDARNKLRRGEVKDSSGMSLKPRGELAKLYEKLDPAKEVIVYCQSGNRAAPTAAVLADLGFRNVKVYDSSWLGYASWLSAPAEDEVWTNFGSLPAAIKGLENRFGELERQATARPKQ